MMTALTRFSVRYPVSVIMLMLGIVLLGIISFDRLGVDLFPALNNPRLYVELQAGERPPLEMEQRYLRDMEALAMRQKGVVDVRAVARTGASRLTVEYAWGTDMDEAFLDLQKVMNSYAQNAEIDELTISQFDPNARPVVLIGFRHPDIADMDELRRVAENYVRNELIRQEGVAAVEIIGGEEKTVQIDVDPRLLEAYGLTLETVAARVRAANLNAAGGAIVEMGRRYIIKGIGEFTSLEDIGAVVVARNTLPPAAPGETPAAVPIYLSEVADIRFAAERPENIVRIDGDRSLALAIYKETQFNTVQAVEQVMVTLEEIRAALPGYRFRILENQGQFIRAAIGEVEETALVGIVLAVLVLYGFLRRVGATTIISIAIPISIIATFNLMFFNGLSLNLMTLGGLALGAGMLVDNAIIVVENIYRQLEEGHSLSEAAVNGTAEVGGAITAATLTTIIVFLPIVYLQGAAGELFKDQAWTVAFSLLSSLVVAILVIPMLSNRLLAREKKASLDAVRLAGYGRFLTRLLAHRGKVVLGAVVITALTVLVLPFVGSEFLPRSEGNSFTLEVALPRGTALEHSDRVAASLETTLREAIGDDLEALYVRIGPAPGLTSGESGFFEGEHSIAITAFLHADRERSLAAVIDRSEAALGVHGHLDVHVKADLATLQATMGEEQAPVVVEISGEDLGVLRDLTERTATALGDLKAVRSLATNFDQGQPELNVVVDRTAAGLYNVTLESITSQLRSHIEGQEAGDWERGGDPRTISVRQHDLSLEDLAAFPVRADNRTVRLDEVARLRMDESPTHLYRRNQARVGSVALQLREGATLDHVAAEIRQRLDGIAMPEGYRARITGEEQQRADAFDNLQFALLLSIVLTYMVLAAQFESLRHPFTVILTVPLAGIGAVWIFLVLGMPLNIMAYIGIIMLVGIAVNDAIILVDAINQLRAEGMERREAIAAAGQRRIRPILMTSLTTILALLPLTLGIGESAALRAPLALAVIGGLVTSTLLTLVVVPCVYDLIDRLRLHGRGAA